VTGPEAITLPSPALFDAVVGQERAVARLTDAARRPVHAYLLHGPPGSGKRAAARGLAAALLCPDGGCGVCNSCRRALAGTHPDLVTVERTGAALDVDDAREITARAQRRPLESARQVLLVPDVHLASKAAPALSDGRQQPARIVRPHSAPAAAITPSGQQTTARARIDLAVRSKSHGSGRAPFTLAR